MIILFNIKLLSTSLDVLNNMAFFERKLNKRLAGFLLGGNSALKEQKGHINGDKSKSSAGKVKDFFKSGLKEMEKELNGMEDIKIKKGGDDSL